VDDRRPWIGTFVVLALVLAGLRWEGRVWVCAGESWWVPWWGDAWSSHTSQHLLDPYSFTHMLHGFVFCGALAWLGKGRWGPAWIVLGAVALEGGWELLENSAFIIDRYRTQTAALDYSGDSILNSVGDLVACGAGAALAYRLGWARGVAVYVAVEVALLAWIRDSLTLNVVMLVYPLEAIRLWQQG
jgi:hypothetical protein